MQHDELTVENAADAGIVVAGVAGVQNPGLAHWGWFISDACWAAGSTRVPPVVSEVTGELTALKNLLLAVPSDRRILVLGSPALLDMVMDTLPLLKSRGWVDGNGWPVSGVVKDIDVLLAEKVNSVDMRPVERPEDMDLYWGASTMAEHAASLFVRSAETFTALLSAGVWYGPGWDPAAAPYHPSSSVQDDEVLDLRALDRW